MFRFVVGLLFEFVVNDVLFVMRLVGRSFFFILVLIFSFGEIYPLVCMECSGIMWDMNCSRCSINAAGKDSLIVLIVS